MFDDTKVEGIEELHALLPSKEEYWGVLVDNLKGMPDLLKEMGVFRIQMEPENYIFRVQRLIEDTEDIQYADVLVAELIDNCAIKVAVRVTVYCDPRKDFSISGVIHHTRLVIPILFVKMYEEISKFKEAEKLASHSTIADCFAMDIKENLIKDSKGFQAALSKVQQSVEFLENEASTDLH